MVNVDWSTLAIGSELEIVKLAPSGAVATRYPGVVIAYDPETTWLAARATWVIHEIETDGLRFVPGDRLHEYFSPTHRFNVFSVFSPEGELRGWYANVTHPSWIDFTVNPPTLYWHDLYVDLIGQPGGAWIVRDEDELAESGLAASDPNLHAIILETRDDLITRAAARDFPFHER